MIKLLVVKLGINVGELAIQMFLCPFLKILNYNASQRPAADILHQHKRKAEYVIALSRVAMYTRDGNSCLLRNIPIMLLDFTYHKFPTGDLRKGPPTSWLQSRCASSLPETPVEEEEGS